MQSSRWASVLLAAALFLSGNAVPAQPKPASQAAVPAVSPMKPKLAAPFERMLVFVYQQNPALVAERQALEIDDEHAAQAFSGFRPTVSIAGEAGRQREAVQGEDWLYGPDASASLIATQPLFSGFGTLEQYRAAKARVEAGRAHLLAAEQRVLFDAVSVWLNVCEKEKILAYTRANLSRMYKYGSSTQIRFNAGDATRTDVAQAEARLADAEAHYASAQADYEGAQASYVRLTGMRPPVTYLPAFLDQLPLRVAEAESLARHHPELAQTIHEEAAAKHDVDAVSSSLWPSVYLRGEMNESRSPELGLARLRDDSVTVNVTIPLYQGGAEYSKVREAKIAHERSVEASEDTLRSVVERARLSWYNYYAACRIITAARTAQSASGRALFGVVQEQAQGLRTTVDVLNAESEFLNTQIAEVQAEKNARLEGYRLLASIGKLTAEGLHLPTPTYNPAAHYDNTVWRAAGF